jgi:uncharacterized protein (TIGR02145 family)
MSVCPAGWRLPSNSDWDKLQDEAGGRRAGQNLKAKSAWNGNFGADYWGTDQYGFSAVAGGYRDTKGGFHNEGHRGWWWSSTARSQSMAGYWHIDDYSNSLGQGGEDKSAGMSVRCVKGY